MSLTHEELTGQIIGAAIEVHKTLGPGYLEAIDENALALELRARSIPFQRQLTVPILYRGSESRAPSARLLRRRPDRR